MKKDRRVPKMTRNLHQWCIVMLSASGVIESQQLKALVHNAGVRIQSPFALGVYWKKK